jgi:hypothetical protein
MLNALIKLTILVDIAWLLWKCGSQREYALPIIIIGIIYFEIEILSSREFSSVGRDMHYICRCLGFEPQSSHLSNLRVKFLVTGYLTKKEKEIEILSQVGCLVPFKCGCLLLFFGHVVYWLEIHYFEINKWGIPGSNPDPYIMLSPTNRVILMGRIAFSVWLMNIIRCYNSLTIIWI